MPGCTACAQLYRDNLTTRVAVPPATINDPLPSAPFTLDARPRNVPDAQCVLVMGAGDVVAKVVGALSLDSADVAAAQHDLLTPNRTLAVLGQQVVSGAKKQVRHQRTTDALVP